MSTPATTPPVPPATPVTSAPLNLMMPASQTEVDKALNKLQEVEDVLSKSGGKPGYNPYLYINNQIKPLRAIIKAGHKKERADEKNEVTNERIVKFNEAVSAANLVSADEENQKVHVFIHPPQEGSRLIGSDGTKTAIMPVE